MKNESSLRPAGVKNDSYGLSIVFLLLQNFSKFVAASDLHADLTIYGNYVRLSFK